MAYKITNMKDIFVDLGKNSYNIIIDKGILSQVGTLISKVISPRKAIIVTDKIVEPLYGNVVLNSLSGCKFDVKLVSIEPGKSRSLWQRRRSCTKTCLIMKWTGNLS